MHIFSVSNINSTPSASNMCACPYVRCYDVISRGHQNHIFVNQFGEKIMAMSSFKY